MSFQHGMKMPGQTHLGFNNMYYPTEEDARIAGRDLMSRWFVPSGFEVVESEKPWNYRFIKNRETDPVFTSYTRVSREEYENGG